VAIESDAEACQKAFSNVCAFISTRDIIQEHIAYRLWPLVDSWKMPKDTIAESSEGGLVRLKYTFRYREKFDEPNDDWLKCIETTSDELLGTYTRAEDDALSLAFGGQGKKRLNRVFDAIGFIYPYYCYLSRRHGKKRKTAASATTTVPKGKKIKVLTHQPRYIETVVVPEFGEGASSAAEAKQAVAATRSTEGSIVVPKVSIVGPAETKDDATREPELEKTVMMPKILSPSVEAELPKVTKAPATTPKRRMASVLDAVIETARILTPAPAKKIVEAATAEAEAEAATVEAEAEIEAEAMPLASVEMEPTATEKEITEEAKFPEPEALSKNLDFIIRHALGKKLSKGEIAEANHYAQKLKYPKGALVFNGTDEDDFLYCVAEPPELFQVKCPSRTLKGSNTLKSE
jgi:hypothetical protein